MWREFIRPELNKLIDATHAMGMCYEQHSCGYIQEVIGDLIEFGVDALQPLMASCNDIPVIKHTYGDKLVLCGCCDTRGIVNNAADEAAVRQEARKSLENWAQGGRFVPSRVVYGAVSKWKKDILEDELCKYKMRMHTKAKAACKTDNPAL